MVIGAGSVGLLDGDGEMDMRNITLTEVTVIGTYIYTAVDVRGAVAMLHSDALGPLTWSDERPLADGQAAFTDLLEGRYAAAKIVLWS
ncbi:MAG: hypothetical protein OES26_25300 [Gammaproteobacteria bacterium]|nr:hypothetical protein [Gammaproteobacteria bacterium]